MPQNSSQKWDSQDGKWLLIYLGITILFSTLFVFFRYPPLQDYPIHLLEAAVINNPVKFEPHYYVHWRPVPYVASQLSIALSSNFIGINAAGRLFYIIYMFVFAAGAFLFTKILLNRSYSAGLAFFLFICNYFFWFGCTNYNLATAMLILFLPLSYRILHWSEAAGLFSAILASLLLYFTHFFPAAIFVLFYLILLWQKRTRWMFYSILLILPVAILSILYIATTTDHSFSWGYGSGLWKISSIKRLLAIPYAWTLDSLSLFSVLNIYNLFVYLAFLSLLAYSAIHIRKICQTDSNLNVVLPLLPCLLALYLITPSNLGPMDVDPRFIFTFILLFLPWILAHLLSLNPGLRKPLISILLAMIGLNFIVSFLLFQSAQKFIAADVEGFLNSRQSREDRVVVNQYYKLADFARTSRFYRLLQPVKLHTDLNQKNLPEEHVDSYFYLEGGFPRKLFVVGLIGKGKKPE